MYYKTTYKSPLGILYLVSDEENLIGLWLEGQKYYMKSRLFIKVCFLNYIFLVYS